MTQEEMRRSIVKLHEIAGTPYSIIAKKIGVSSAYICLWLRGDRTFSDEVKEEAEKVYLEIIEGVKSL